jgi:3-oxoadipate enol-lactonase
LGRGTVANAGPVEGPTPSYLFGTAGSGVGRYRDERPLGPEKATVLLLHGWAGTAELNWSHVYAPLVAAGYRVLAPDLPGHGGGARDIPFTFDGVADAAASLVKDSGAEKVVVAGHSMGGSIALTLAGHHPDQVRGLVLMATQASWPGIPPNFLLKVAGRLGMVAARPLLRWGARSILSGEAARDGWIHEELRPTSVAHLAQALVAMHGFDAEPWLAQVRIPVVVLVTTRDTAVAPARQRQLAAAIPGARLMEVAIDHSDPPSRPGPFPEGLVAAVEQCVEMSAATL